MHAQRSDDNPLGANVRLVAQGDTTPSRQLGRITSFLMVRALLAFSVCFSMFSLS